MHMHISPQLYDTLASLSLFRVHSHQLHIAFFKKAILLGLHRNSFTSCAFYAHTVLCFGKALRVENLDVTL